MAPTENGAPAAVMPPHALVLPFPAQGHIGPMMQLSIKLASHGVLITFLTTQFNIPLLRPLIHLLRRLRLPIRLSQIIDDKRGSGDTTGSSSIVQICESLFSLIPSFDTLVHPSSDAFSAAPVNDDVSDDDTLFDAVPLTCIISDLYLHFTQDLASKHGLKHVAFWTAGAGMLANTMALMAHGLPLPPGLDDVITWIPGVPALKRREINQFLCIPDPHDFMYALYRDSYRKLSETSLIAINTVEDLEAGSLAALRADNVRNVLAIGPLLPESYVQGSASEAREEELPTAALWREDHEGCCRWLSQQAAQTVLYVSFGSIAIMSGEQLEELAEGLADSGAAVLWVLRPDLLSQANGGEVILKRFRQRMGDAAYVTEWAPQLRVLSHPSVGGFLSHCGWNSTLESLVAGVPVIGWPYFADQMLNNRCLVELWGCGAEFRADEGGVVRREEISGVVSRVMLSEEGAALRVAAERWQKAARMAGSGESGEAFRGLLRCLETGSREVA